jgi:NitT/TauT family transport system ATP-binding protein
MTEQLLSARLQVKDLVKAFDTPQGSLPVLDHISFTLNAGEIVTIVGASGSGKTTLLRMIAGLDAPDSGQLLLNGQAITKPGPDRAMIFQQFGLMPWLNVQDNVNFGMHVLGLSDDERHARTQDAIERVGLKGFETFLPKNLSGGMQQRVGIARALAVRPDVLLCDEPFAAVDAMTRQVMQTDLLNIVTAQGTTALLVTHDIEEALFLGDRVLVFSSRPARLIHEFQVPIAKPRQHEVRTTSQFQDMRAHVWSLLQSQARELV